MSDPQPNPSPANPPDAFKHQFELVVRLVEPDSKADPKPDRFAQVIDLTKAIAWPVFGLIMLVAFWGPLYSTIEQLPNLVSRSENITIAGLTLEIEKGLRQQASPEVRQVLSELSPEGVRNLLTASEASYWNEGSTSYGRTANAELVNLGLLEEIPTDELNEPQGSTSYGYGVRLTPFGKETQTFLFDLISEFVQELEQQE